MSWLQPSWRLGAWAVLYVFLGSALTATSYVLDERLKTPTGLTQTFYEGKPSDGVVRFRRTTPKVDLTFLDTDPSLPRRLFGVRWEGVWYLKDARWIDLYAGGDDLVKVAIDDRIVIERNAALGMGTKMLRFPLSAGPHRLVVVHEQYGGGYFLNVRMGPAGGVPGSFDPEWLFPDSPSSRQLATNQTLRRFRQAAIAAWIAPPFAAILWVALPGMIGAGRRLLQSWLRRHRDNWRRPLSSSESTSVAARPTASIRAMYLVVVMGCLGSIWRFHDSQTGFTSLIGFGDRFQNQTLAAARNVPHYVYEHSAGYDGQFYAQLALEPLLRNRDLNGAMDSVPYRARRILLAWTAFVLGMGRPSSVLQAFAIQNVGYWLLLGALLLRWLPPVNLRNWLAWCGCLLGYGSISSIRFALTDGPSMTLIALGIAAAEGGRTYVAAGVMGWSGLARETNLLAALGLDWSRPWDKGRLARGLVATLLVVSPLILWMCYMQAVFGPRVWFASNNNFGVPLEGLLSKLEVTITALRMDGWASPARYSVMALVSTAVQAAYLGWRAEWHRPWWRVGIVYAAFMAFFSFPVWQGDPGAFVRVLLPMTIACNVLLPHSRWFWPLFVLGNLTMVQGVETLWVTPP